MRAAISIGWSALCAASLVAVAAYAQDSHDCRNQPERDLLTGRWRDDGNGKLVDIASTYTTANQAVSVGTGEIGAGGPVVAKYVEANQCRFPDRGGNFEPLPTDFEGDAASVIATDLVVIDASMYYCTFAKDGGETHTISIASRGFTGKVYLDFQSITGTFFSPDGPQPVHFTRVSKLDKPKLSDDSKQSGHVYVSGPTLYQEPSASSPLAPLDRNATAGARAVFSQIVFEAGTPAWYRVQFRSGAPAGWVPANEISCARPGKGGYVRRQLGPGIGLGGATVTTAGSKG